MHKVMLHCASFRAYAVGKVIFRAYAASQLNLIKNLHKSLVTATATATAAAEDLQNRMFFEE